MKPSIDFGAEDASHLQMLGSLLLSQQAIFDNAGVGILFVRERCIQQCNKEAARLFDWPHAEMSGRPGQLFHPSEADYEEFDRAASAALVRGERYEAELTLLRRDSSRFLAHVNGCLVDRHDAQAGTIWIVQDITERRRAEQALQLTLLEQDAILENASIGIVFLKDRVIQRCNRRFADLFGRTPAELLQRSTRCLYANDEEFRRGAAPYRLLVRGESHTREQELVRRDGSRFWCRLTGRVVDCAHPELESVWLFEDVTEQRAARELLELRVQQRTAELAQANERLRQEIVEREQAQQRMQHLANHDELTGLPNRRLLIDRMEQALALARRAGHQVAVLCIDLDRFKAINDSLGHAVGDMLLKSVARRIAANARAGDTVARLGSDEFVMVLPQVAHEDDLVAVARKTMQTLAMPLHVQGRSLHVTPSIGIALSPADGDAPEALLRSADSATHHAKQAGGDDYQFFSPRMNASTALRFELENDLHRALERGELFLEYQPRIDLRDGSFKAVEALVRWRHPRRGLLNPASFIPLVEETGLIVRLGEWTIRRACRQIGEWQEQGGDAITVAVNLSPRQFQQAPVAERIGMILADAGVPTRLIELEITETTLMQHTEQTLATLDRLHRMGLRIAIDDFGIGYSSLSYLRRFPIAQLKIDQSFVRELGSDRTSAAIVSAVATLAGNLDLSVVAEGVETVEQLDIVRRCGCDQAQGFLFSRPMPPEKVPLMLRRDWLAHAGRAGV